jgi:hypothetical protein
MIRPLVERRPAWETMMAPNRSGATWSAVREKKLD